MAASQPFGLDAAGAAVTGVGGRVVWSAQRMQVPCRGGWCNEGVMKAYAGTEISNKGAAPVTQFEFVM
jgi:hypothetical protein